MKLPLKAGLIAAIPALTLALSLPVTAQETTVRETTENVDGSTTTTTTSGTINEFGDNRIVVRTETSEKPLTYGFTKTTTYVDEAGAPVSIETVKSGLPVTIHYVKEGDGLVARKVIVRKTRTTPAGTAETTTTTTTGTIGEFGTDRIVVRTTTAKEPLHYRYTKTTTYVDEAGNPVSVKTVKSGLPVTVHYVKEGDGLVATRVIVRKTLPAAAPPAERIETTERTTTTAAGTVSSLEENRILVRTEAVDRPLSYTFNETTTYVDEAGAPLTREIIKSGLPVTMHYVKDGETMVVRKVVVRKR